MPRPNILFAAADQWRGDGLGVVGQSWLRSPNVDRLALAGSGYYFSHCYSVATLCPHRRQPRDGLDTRGGHQLPDQQRWLSVAARP